LKDIDRRAFTAQLSTLLGAGTPLAQALRLIQSTTTAQHQKWINFLINAINRGESFSNALKNSKQNFDSFYCGMIEVGEQSGTLPLLLKNISNHLESSARLNAKIRKALAYPAAVLMIAIAIIVSMLIWVIPTFESVFSNFNSNLPTPTAIVIQASNFLRNHLVTSIIFISFVIFLLACYWNYSIKFQKLFDKFILKIPFIGRLNRSALLSKWLLTIDSLQQSGTPLLKAIRISARCSNQWAIHETSAQIYQHLSQGFSIYEAALISNKNYQVFDALSLQLLKIGEDSGALSDMLTYLSGHHEKQVDDAIGILIELLEPILVCFLGLVVGGMVIALYLPLFQLGQLT
jgi:type IV pilus assembly protein PilC